MDLLRNGQFLRATFALCLGLTLVVALLDYRGRVSDAGEQRAFGIIDTAWKVSELVLETQRTELALVNYSGGSISRDDLILRFELLWSRVGVLKGSRIGDADGVARLVAGFEEFLDRSEDTIYDAEVITRAELQRISEELRVQGNAVRSFWVEQFSNNRANILDRSAPEAGLSLVLIERIVAIVAALLLLYLIAEIWFTNRARREQERLRQAANQASDAKSQFLANMSHEIRTPLNGIIGTSQALRDTQLDLDQNRLVDVMCDSGDVLLTLINSVLDLSKIEAGKLELEVSEFDLGQQVRSAVSLFESTAKAKGLALDLGITPETEGRYRGDHTRLRQIISNLVSNALKFTAEGRVTVSLEYRDGQLRLTVEDTGIGITPDAIESIFQPFGQADASDTRRFGGTGLGLAICRELASAMNGSISAQSEPGRGTTFAVVVALERVGPVIEATQTAQHRRGSQSAPVEAWPLRVLAAEDNKTNRFVLARMLKPMVSTLDFANDGLEALEAWRGGDYDLILMDIQMPLLSGIEAARAIRQEEHEAGVSKRVTIMAASANVMDDQVASYRGAGMDGHIAKPLRRNELAGILAQVAGALPARQDQSDQTEGVAALQTA